MGIKECCSAFIAGLPDPALPIIPSMILGSSFAAFFLIICYKRETKLPLKIIFIEIVKKIFFLFPSHDHSESGVCRNPDCIRCKKYEEITYGVIEKWEVMKKQKLLNLPRIKSAIDDLEKEYTEFSRGEIESDVTAEPEKKHSRRPSLQKPTLFYMDLAANPYWDEFDIYKAELGLLKLNVATIMKEFGLVFDEFQKGNTWGWKLNDIPSGHWCVFPFIDQGIENESNCRRCPNTSVMLSTLAPVMKDCVFGNASFSVLYPNSSIEPHHGPTNLRLRCHLGLHVPAGCWLEVAGTQYKWKVGETVIFDDSFEHSATFIEVASASQALPRAVLMIDFWHPDVTVEERKALAHLFSP